MRLFTLTVGTALAFGLGTAVLAVPVPNDEVMMQNGHEFVCTGVGKHAQEDPRWDAFPLKLVFANQRGDYLSNITVSLTDTAGGTVIDAHCDAPWLLAKLQPGTYQAQVTTGEGLTKTVDVAVPANGQKQVVVTFNQD